MKTAGERWCGGKDRRRRSASEKPGLPSWKAAMTGSKGSGKWNRSERRKEAQGKGWNQRPYRFSRTHATKPEAENSGGRSALLTDKTPDPRGPPTPLVVCLLQGGIWYLKRRGLVR